MCERAMMYYTTKREAFWSLESYETTTCLAFPSHCSQSNTDALRKTIGRGMSS